MEDGQITAVALRCGYDGSILGLGEHPGMTILPWGWDQLLGGRGSEVPLLVEETEEDA